MAKRNLTIQYFDRPNACDGTHDVLGPTGIPENRQPIMRLGWNMAECSIDWNALSQMIEHSALPDAVFFLDSSFFDRQEIPWVAWQALLSRKIAFTPLIWNELKDWRTTPFANRAIRDDLLKLLESKDPRVEILDTTKWPDRIRDSARHYVELLGCRKLVGIGIASQLREESGREPTSDEVTRELQRMVRERGLTLARKGAADVAKPNFLANEQLVVCAVINGILTGCETTILTRDVDLMEQFYKLVYLLDTDYRSLLIANSYKAAPDNLIVQKVEHNVLDQVYKPGEKEVLLLPRRFKQWVLPEEHNWVNVSCKRIAGQGEPMKYSDLSFCADQEMSLVLEGGLEDSDGRRPRICISPPFAEALANHVFVGGEKETQFGPWEHSAIDIDYVLHEVEHFRRARVDPRAAAKTTSLGLDLAAFRLEERLMFSIQPEWHDFSNAELADAMKYVEPSAIVLCDGSFLRSDSATELADVFTQRGLATSSKVLAGAVSSATPKLKGILKQDRLLDVFAPTEQDYTHGFGYYLAMLAFRKQYGSVIQQQVEREYGRVSPADEWPQIVEHYAGVRGRHVAVEGDQRRGDDTLFYSDELLIQGFLSSIVAGADVVFLTCDPVFMDQFVKLCRFAKEHYLAYRLGQCMRESPASFPTNKVSAGDGKMEFECHDLKPGWEARVLPPNPYYLNLHCWLIAPGPRLCVFTFCAERPMHKMLRVKGDTGGLNVQRDDGRNLRIADARNGPVAILTNEKLISFGHDSLPSDPRIDLRISSMAETDLIHIVHQREVVDPVWFNNS